MQPRIFHTLLGVLCLLGFAVLMALRSELSSFAARIAVAALAGAFLGAAILQARKARTA
ncbi:Hypothetical protein A7982_09537 [Minicystis rosea]|nr:Hypothetical protein A7982_09537 [Minicystis rosea]